MRESRDLYKHLSLPRVVKMKMPMNIMRESENM